MRRMAGVRHHQPSPGDLLAPSSIPTSMLFWLSDALLLYKERNQTKPQPPPQKIHCEWARTRVRACLPQENIKHSSLFFFTAHTPHAPTQSPVCVALRAFFVACFCPPIFSCCEAVCLLCLRARLGRTAASNRSCLQRTLFWPPLYHHHFQTHRHYFQHTTTSSNAPPPHPTHASPDLSQNVLWLALFVFTLALSLLHRNRAFERRLRFSISTGVKKRKYTHYDTLRRIRLGFKKKGKN